MNERERAGQAEWDKWRELTKALIESGTITKDDAEAKASDVSTPGRKLFKTIRDWGKLLVALDKA